jgi:hypothetical protein
MYERSYWFREIFQMMNNGEVAAQGAGADFQSGEVVGAGVHVASGIGSGDGVTVGKGVINGQGVTVGSGEGMGTGMFAGSGEGTGMMVGIGSGVGSGKTSCHIPDSLIQICGMTDWMMRRPHDYCWRRVC